MAQGADRLYIQMMRSGIALVVIVLVPALALFPHVAAIDARERVGMRSAPGSHLHIDALPGL